MIRMLHPGAPPAPTGTLAEVPALIETFTGSGLRVNYTERGCPMWIGFASLAAGGALRAVNGSLTNFAKHAPHGELELLVAMHAQSVQFTAANPLGNGTGSEGEPAAQPTTGTGLRSMHAHSSELGGSFQAGVNAGHFALNMLLPLGNP